MKTGVLAGPAGVVIAPHADTALVSDKADGLSSWASYAEIGLYAQYLF